MIKKILFSGILVETMLIAGCSSSNNNRSFDYVKYEQRCNQGVIESCNVLAEWYEKTGQNDLSDRAYERSCNLGSWIGCRYSKKHKNSERSVNTESKTGECNSGSSCFGLGNIYYNNDNYNKARELYERSCSFDYGDGCWKLGYLYDLGTGVAQNSITANSYYRKACSFNNAVACINLGNYYAYGTEEPNNYQWALDFYKKACDLGNKIGCENYDSMAVVFKKDGCDSGSECFNLAYSYYQNHDYQKARDFYQKSCSLDYGEGCGNLGYLYDNGLGVTQNDFYANSYYRKACYLNNATACNNLGIQYAKGESKNYQEALDFYKKACDLGNENGCTYHKNLAAYLKNENENTQNKDCQNGDECLTKGTRYGNEGDFSRAGVYYGYACDFGNGSGCSKLGLLFEEGVGGYSQNFEKAAQYFEKACNYGEANGCNNLASLFEEGRGCVQNNFRAKELYAKSCSMKNASACFTLGHMYENAIGTRQDLYKAKENYGLSCDYGFQPGCDAHKRLNR